MNKYRSSFILFTLINLFSVEVFAASWKTLYNGNELIIRDDLSRKSSFHISFYLSEGPTKNVTYISSQVFIRIINYYVDKNLETDEISPKEIFMHNCCVKIIESIQQTIPAQETNLDQIIISNTILLNLQQIYLNLEDRQREKAPLTSLESTLLDHLSSNFSTLRPLPDLLQSSLMDDASDDVFIDADEFVDPTLAGAGSPSSPINPLSTSPTKLSRSSTRSEFSTSASTGLAVLSRSNSPTFKRLARAFAEDRRRPSSPDVPISFVLPRTSPSRIDGRTSPRSPLAPR